jgi:hypothetical protein
MWRIITEGPKPLSHWRDDLPVGLEAPIFVALNKDPENRHASAERFAAELRQTLVRRETEIGVALRERVRHDFTGDMPSMLRIEPLAERDRAWRNAKISIPPDPPTKQIDARPAVALNSPSQPTITASGVPSLADHFLMVPLALFTTAVPLPFGALGLSEQVSEQLFKLVRHPSGAVAMMGYRLMMYGGGFVSVIVYLFNLAQVRQLSSAASDGSDSDENAPAIQPVADGPPRDEDGDRGDERSVRTAENLQRDVGAEPLM